MNAAAPLPFPAVPGRADWRQAELERLWFPRVEAAEQLRCENPQLSWQIIAETHYHCGESTLRYWRRRYWQARQAAS